MLSALTFLIRRYISVAYYYCYYYYKKNWSSLSLGEFFKFQFLLTLMLILFIYYFIKEVETTMFHEFFYQIKDKINPKFKT